MDEFYQSSYGGIRLWCAEITTVNNNTLVVHQLTSGNTHPIQRRGQDLKEASCVLLFDDMRGESDSPLVRFRKFRDLVNEGDPQIFTHPIEGSYLAVIGAFTHTVNGDGTITANCTVMPHEEARAVSPGGTGSSLSAGEGVVEAAADNAEKALEDFGLETVVIDKSRAMVEEFEAETPNTRAITAAVSELSSEIGEAIDSLGLDQNISLWPAYRSMMFLADSILTAGRAATEVTRVVTILINRPTALRRLMAKLFGAFEADERYAQVMNLNDIATPAWIPMGTELRIPQPPPQQRRG